MTNEEKYKWHDLQKNPEDLPEDCIDTLVAYKEGWYGVEFYRADMLYEDDIIAWKYIDPFCKGAIK